MHRIVKALMALCITELPCDARWQQIKRRGCGLVDDSRGIGEVLPPPGV